ncbi:type II toxin-antitoxin system RelE/ParE family toxin [Microbacterium sp. NPDC057407]|uniref:type II toxin-antitoxin system RelE/ParE family toxin n=1 Tax=Microbacterium sp. NPDC057407 TaxID=3346120 RepID=UPI00367131C1
MTRRVVTTRGADVDIDAAVQYYSEVADGEAMLGLIDALQDAVRLLAEHPSIGSPRLEVLTGVRGLRGLPLRRYPYVLVYTDDTDAVRVHRVLHSSRDIPSELADL